jgi:hypothetical protein
MLRALRRNGFASVFALLVIAGSVPLSVAALLHDAIDDQICQPAFIVHDESAHRFEATRTTAPESQHCYICHFLQSLRTVEATVAVAAPSTSSQQLSWSSDVAVGVSTLGHVPARAPPVG